MNKFSVCIEPVFEGMDDVEKIRKVNDLGFSAVEFWDPAEKDRRLVKNVCDELGMSVAICTLEDPWGDVRLHAETSKYVDHFEKSLLSVKELGCKKVILLSGEDDGLPHKKQVDRIIENLSAVGPIAEKEGVILCLEALNSKVDHPGYFLDSSILAFSIVKEVKNPNVKVLYDVYHMQIMEGNIIDTIEKNIEFIGHFHSAGVPGRHEHYFGELNYPGILEALDRLGNEEHFGLEYWPTMNNEISLKEVFARLREH